MREVEGCGGASERAHGHEADTEGTGGVAGGRQAAGQEGECVTLAVTVRDTGAGIPAERQASIFERYNSSGGTVRGRPA